MNATNRGVLQGVYYSLDKISDVLHAMAEKEDDKERALDGGAPLETIRGNSSLDLKMAVSSIVDAMEYIKGYLPQNVDFEDYL